MHLLSKIRQIFGRCEKCWNYAWDDGRLCTWHTPPGTYPPVLGVVQPPLVEECELNAVTPYVYTDGKRAFAPHCDQSVLHAPGECPFCDHYPDWQWMRAAQRINFTGHVDKDKAPCPSAHWRTAEQVHQWPGNTPEGYL